MDAQGTGRMKTEGKGIKERVLTADECDYDYREPH